jgi:MOSC domain-containing protein YiiM
MEHLDITALEDGLEEIRRAPRDAGTVELIVRRPTPEEREVVAEAELDPAVGLVGDGWLERGSRATEDGSAHPEMQLTMMSARAAALIASTRDRWPLAGDQLYVDLDISSTNLPPGTRLEVGTATIEITDQPHTGCGKFVRRFGVDAMRFVNSPVGRELNLRGIYARILSAGTVRRGDSIRKAAP